MKVVTSELSDDELAVLESVDSTVEIVLADTADDLYRTKIYLYRS